MKYGCIDVLLRQGVAREDIVELEVPGAFELPFAAKSVILKASPSTGNIDAVVALGCLIKGETMHLSQSNSQHTHTHATHPYHPSHTAFQRHLTHSLQPPVLLCFPAVSTSVLLCLPV